MIVIFISGGRGLDRVITRYITGSMSVPRATIRAMPDDLERLRLHLPGQAQHAGPLRLPCVFPVACAGSGWLTWPGRARAAPSASGSPRLTPVGTGWRLLAVAGTAGSAGKRVR